MGDDVEAPRSTGTEVQRPSASNASGARWSQYCTFHGATDLTEINHFLQEQGDRGWELASLGGRNATIYCFKMRQ